jgi:hypothetical protein
MGYVLFFVIHIIQVILAGWNNFRAMVTGFEVIRIREQEVVALVPAEPLQDTVPTEEITEDVKTEQDRPDQEIQE